MYTDVATIRAASGFNIDTNITDETIERYIGQADSVIDIYISDAYTLPLASVPEIIQMLSEYITIAILNTNEYGEESQDSDKGWQKRMDFAMSLLEKIQKRKLKLKGDDGTELATTSLYDPSFRPTLASSQPGEEDEPRITMKTQL